MKLNFLLSLSLMNAGACLYNLQAHEDCLVSIASAPSYIITLGLDERIRVWERFQGHLLNTINLHQAHSNSIVMLTPSLLITAKPGNLFFHYLLACLTNLSIFKEHFLCPM